MRGLLLDESGLHRIGMFARAQAFQRHYLPLRAASNRDHAGTCCDTVHQHGAGPAFAKPAAVFGAVQSKIVAQHVKQRGVGSRLDVMAPAIDVQADR